MPRIKAPEGRAISFLAFDATHHRLLAGTDLQAGNPAFLWMAAGDDVALTPISSRRVTQMDHRCVNQNGDLIFTSGGDLWHGFVDASEDRPVLVAYRWLAVAEQETHNGTPSGQGAFAVACSGGRIIMDHSRMHGSGWGAVWSIPQPAMKLGPEFRVPRLSASALETTRVLGDLQEIADTGGMGVCFATTPNGQETYHLLTHSEHFLICEPEPTGK